MFTALAFLVVAAAAEQIRGPHQVDRCWDGHQACREDEVELAEGHMVKAMETTLLQLDATHLRAAAVAALRHEEAQDPFHTADSAADAAAAAAVSPAPTIVNPEKAVGEEVAEQETARRVAVEVQAEAAAQAVAAKTTIVVAPLPTTAATELLPNIRSEQDANVHPGPLLHGHAGHHSQLGSRSQIIQVAFTGGVFIVGIFLILIGLRTAGMLALYFGGQAGFSLYIKVVLSNATVSEAMHMKGVPAGFLVTAVQQAVAFVFMAVVLLLLYPTPFRYTPRRLNSFKELAAVLLFSMAFAVNIGLNNFSLSLMAVSINLIIRSCLPLVTLVLQQLFGLCASTGSPSVKVSEVTFMVAGVFFAGLATVAKSEGASGGSDSESSHLYLGVLMCGLSDIAAAINLVLASFFGAVMDPPLNPVDTIWYMAIPCALFLVPAAIHVAHPVDWPGAGQLTDWEVFKTVMDLRPETMLLVLLSGVFAAGYNVLQYAVVQSLSATHAAFAGNFNKAATIVLSIALGLEMLPSDQWGTVMLVAIVGNIAAFTGYSLLKVGDKAPKAPPAGAPGPSSEAASDGKL